MKLVHEKLRKGEVMAKKEIELKKIAGQTLSIKPMREERRLAGVILRDESELVRSINKSKNWMSTIDFAMLRRFKHYWIDRKLGYYTAIKQVAEEFKKTPEEVEKIIQKILKRFVKDFVEGKEEKQAFAKYVQTMREIQKRRPQRPLTVIRHP